MATKIEREMAKDKKIDELLTKVDKILDIISKEKSSERKTGKKITKATSAKSV